MKADGRPKSRLDSSRFIVQTWRVDRQSGQRQSAHRGPSRREGREDGQLQSTTLSAAVPHPQILQQGGTHFFVVRRWSPDSHRSQEIHRSCSGREENWNSDRLLKINCSLLSQIIIKFNCHFKSIRYNKIKVQTASSNEITPFPRKFLAKRNNLFLKKVLFSKLPIWSAMQSNLPHRPDSLYFSTEPAQSIATVGLAFHPISPKQKPIDSWLNPFSRGVVHSQIGCTDFLDFLNFLGFFFILFRIFLGVRGFYE